MNNKNFFKYIYSEKFKNFSKAIQSLNIEETYKFISEIKSLFHKKRNIFVCGNGGSWAIANHMLCDFNKNIYFKTKKSLSPKFISLSNNMELVSAISNDISYNDIFSLQFDNLSNKNDALFIISSSGNSKNVIQTINVAKKKKINVFSMTGFNGGIVKKKSNFNINISSNNIGTIEDCHHYIMHLFVDYLSESE